MILTKLPCSTGHRVHMLPSVTSALVFRLTALHRWFFLIHLWISVPYSYWVVVSGCYSAKKNNSDFPKCTALLQSARLAYPAYHFIPCPKRKLQNLVYPLDFFCKCEPWAQHHVLVTSTNDRILHCHIKLKTFVENLEKNINNFLHAWANIIIYAIQDVTKLVV